MRFEERVILHVDMDAFFAQAEVLAAPRLRGLPLVIGGGPGGRGVVASASYEAREFGVRSGMPIAKARGLCPSAVLLPCHPPRYLDLSARLLKTLLRVGPVVEMASIDEAFLDASGIVDDLESGGKLACRIQGEIRSRLGLGCSVGVAPNKLVSKMASPLGKPAGMTVMDRAAFIRTFGPRPVRVLYGVGAATERLLSTMGVETVADLAKQPAAVMGRRFGVWGRLLRDAARGEDRSPVIPHHASPAPKSLGHEYTLPRDSSDRREIRRILLALADEVARDLRSEGWVGATVHLKVRWSDFHTRFLQRRVADPTDSTGTILRAAEGLFESLGRGRSVRMMGISVSGLNRTVRWQCGDIFDDGRLDRLDRAIDRIRESLGVRSLRRASLMPEKREARSR